MGFSLKFCYCLAFVMVLLPAVCYSQNFVRSRATNYGTPDGLGTSSGACGFEGYGRTINGAQVAAVSNLYKNGAGCGACYQVKCTNPQLCGKYGVNVVVTDYGQGDRTDFILSPRAFAGMARPGAAKDLFAKGVVDVDYKRVPCYYGGQKLQFKVTKNSGYPNYLAIIVLYQPGKNDIIGIDILEKGRKQWVAMRRAYGAVFDMANPPQGPISLRIQLSGSTGFKVVEAPNAIPSNWKPGVAYDSNVQL